MPRLPRSRTSHQYYHIVLRGNRCEALISTAADRRALNQIAIEALQRFDATLHAYCLMTNHFRALIQIDDRLLVKALRLIVTRYSLHRRRHSKFTKHVFERPYEAQRIDTDGEFLNLLRFIHLSPVIANTVITPADYRWSSHRAYIGYKSVAWITTDFGLSLLADDPAQARAAYHQFMAEEPPIDVALALNPNKQQAAESSEALAEIPSTLVNSRIKLRGIGKRALTRLIRTRKRKPSHRFLSIY